MTTPARPSSDVAFSDQVKSEQSRRGSRAGYARLERGGGFETEIGNDLAAFVASQRSAFLATASAGGQPYVQHRGGPAGFLRVLDPHTIAFADFAGNRQYISLGNLAENSMTHLFLIDYQRRQRIKIWGEARVVEDDPALLARLTPVGYKAKPEPSSSASPSEVDPVPRTGLLRFLPLCPASSSRPGVLGFRP